MKTKELQGAALDWAVAKCAGPSMMAFFTRNEYTPSTDWEQGGPIIEREQMYLSPHDDGYLAHFNDDRIEYYGSTPLIAAMRCYVTSRLGDEVEIPKGI